MCGAVQRTGETNEEIGGERERIDVVPDFLPGGVPLDGENLFSADRVAGQCAIGETASQDRSSVFGSRFKYIDHATKIERPETEMSRK